MQTLVSPGQTKRQRYVATKLNLLYDVMQESKRGYEKIASTSSDRNYQRAFSSLALECNQYANELYNQICSLGEHPMPEKKADQHIWNQVSLNIKQQDDIIKACNGSERIITKAYQEVLNDPTVVSPLRGMINYQLNGIKYAFVKVKLLNTTLAF
jgi:uncharacterized protein (TIGR02284 family)